MRNFKRDRVWRNVLESKPVLIFLGLVLLFFAWSVFGLLNKMIETGRNKRAVEDNITSLEAQKEKLSSDINSLNTDEGKEKVFRENFGLAKDGEGEIVVLDDNTQPATQAQPSGGFWSSLMFWKNW